MHTYLHVHSLTHSLTRDNIVIANPPELVSTHSFSLLTPSHPLTHSLTHSLDCFVGRRSRARRFAPLQHNDDESEFHSLSRVRTKTTNSLYLPSSMTKSTTTRSDSHTSPSSPSTSLLSSPHMRTCSDGVSTTTPVSNNNTTRVRGHHRDQTL